jgi:Xaa-Pro dipeptidase
MDLKKIQSALVDQKIDGWLFCDFHNREHIAQRVLGLNNKKFASRRWFYFVPRSGAPRKLVHAIEPGMLDALPGGADVYASWEQLRAKLRTLVKGAKKIAMQYSPLNNIPTNSLVDAGTIELVRSCGAHVVSSADLVQQLYSLLDAKGWRSHQKAGVLIQQIKNDAFDLIFSSVKKNKPITELDVQKFILKRFKKENLTCGHGGPIVGANEHAADPHFEPTEKNAKRLKRGDKILIDLWAKFDEPGAIYYDITWCGFIGDNPPPEYVRVFGLAMRARDAALDFIGQSIARKKPIRGWEVDKVCRGIIAGDGLGEHFVHRTGHSIDTSVHGEGANIDSLETQDDRQLIPGALFSIEPGIYLPKKKLGVRTEIDGFIDFNGELKVAGEIQKSLILMNG